MVSNSKYFGEVLLFILSQTFDELKYELSRIIDSMTRLVNLM